ncbi:MAG: hypothetical protein GX640_07490, partial [Fibrobacter sp.]|nr:hypothetical protein [Fibrobacter sp.]
YLLPDIPGIIHYGIPILFFDTSVIELINQKINSNYLDEFTNVVRKHSKNIEFFTIDIILDAFGSVTMFRVYNKDNTSDNNMVKSLNSLIQKWNFPFVATMTGHSGKCTISFIISSWETHYSEMIPFPQ